MDEPIATATVWTEDGYKTVPASEAHKYPPAPLDLPTSTVINVHCVAYTPKKGDTVVCTVSPQILADTGETLIQDLRRAFPTCFVLLVSDGIKIEMSRPDKEPTT